MFRFTLAMLLLAAAAGRPVHAEATRLIAHPFPWKPVAALKAPKLPDGIPAAAAGCIVVGHYILADGTTDKARVMQGAFTPGLDDRTKSAFQAAALSTVAQWRFRYVRESTEPWPEFNVEAVGFAPIGTKGAMSAVVGLDAQDARVRASCALDDLAEWGERNAIPEPDAAARSDDRLLVAQEGAPQTYWTMRGQATPPEYPPGAARSGTTACVVVGFVIGVNGAPDYFRIMTSRVDGPGDDAAGKDFESAALHATSQWRYSPGPDNLTRKAEFRQVPVDFSLEGTRKAPACETVDVTKSGLDLKGAARDR